MFYEYAVDPAVISSWESARYFLDALGPWKGRFLAEYPKHWRRLVYESLTTCPDVEKKRIEEQLRRLDRRILLRRSGAQYDKEKQWLENAEIEHKRQAFRAIITTEKRAEDFILDNAELDERNPRWQVEQGQLISRDPLVIAQTLRLLLRVSTKVVVIDPYFRADQVDKIEPLKAFWKFLRDRQVEFEIHASDTKLSYQESMRLAQRALPGILPEGMKVQLHCWKEKSGGPRLHNRYLLTEVAGVQFGDGIEQGAEGHVDRLSIIEESSRLTLWVQYLGNPPAFDEAGPPQYFERKMRSTSR